MDSLWASDRARRRGGPGGEHLARACLEHGLLALGYRVTVLRSEVQLARVLRYGTEEYAALFFDRFTVGQPDSQAWRFVRRRAAEVYLLDFFGAAEVTPSELPLRNHLVPHPNRSK